MTRFQWCFSFFRMTFGILGVVIAVSVMFAGEREDYKCTYGNYPPSCMCQDANPVVTDRCAAAVPVPGEPAAYNTECGPMTNVTCNESVYNTANPCGNIYNCIGHDCDEWWIGAYQTCIPFTPAQKAPCSGTWGYCDKNLASW